MKQSFLVVAASLWFFWMVLAYHLDLIHTLIGMVISGVIALLCFDVIEQRWLFPLKWNWKVPGRLLVYYVRRIMDISRANIDLAERLLDPQLPINPAIIRLKHNLRNPVARALLANSVTLTPGTLTVEISNEDIYIHFLAEEYLDLILSRDLNQQIKFALCLDEEKK